MKKLGAALACGTLILLPTYAFAWFEICNTKANGASMYVTYAYYEPNTTTVYTDACGSFSRVFSPQYYTAWKNTGWWHLSQNQCATVYGPGLSNTWGYVYALISDGSSLVGADTPLTVSNVAFGIDQYVSGPFGQCSGECIGQSGSGDCWSGVTYWNVKALPINQDSFTNYTENIY